MPQTQLLISISKPAPPIFFLYSINVKFVLQLLKSRSWSPPLLTLIFLSCFIFDPSKNPLGSAITICAKYKHFLPPLLLNLFYASHFSSSLRPFPKGWSSLLSFAVALWQFTFHVEANVCIENRSQVLVLIYSKPLIAFLSHSVLTMAYKAFRFWIPNTQPWYSSLFGLLPHKAICFPLRVPYTLLHQRLAAWNSVNLRWPDIFLSSDLLKYYIKYLLLKYLYLLLKQCCIANDRKMLVIF